MEPIGIAGAGIGGLSAAIALARHGLAVRVYERVTQLREAGAGIQLGPNAFRMFERLGVQHPMQDIAFEPRWLCRCLPTRATVAQARKYIASYGGSEAWARLKKCK